MPALPFKASAQQIFASAAADRPEPETSETVALTALISRFVDVRVRFQIIGHARIKNVGKYQSCMVSKLPVIWKQTVRVDIIGHARIRYVGKYSVMHGLKWPIISTRTVYLHF